MINRVSLGQRYNPNYVVRNNETKMNNQISFTGIKDWFTPKPPTDEHVANYIKALKEGTDDLENHFRDVWYRAKKIEPEQWKKLEAAARELKSKDDEAALSQIQDIAKQAKHTLPEDLLPNLNC